MSILCTICTDQLASDENLQSTRCGHIFHHHCLSHWIQTSNTCPQCRKVVGKHGLCRLYPTFSEEESRECEELQSTLGDALQELSCLRTACEEKDVRLKHLTDTINEQRWREKLADALQPQNIDMAQLQMQLKHLKAENGNMRSELEQLRQDSVVRAVFIGVISGTIGIAFGILLYPYIYPMPVQQSCWQKSVGFVNSYINRLF